VNKTGKGSNQSASLATAVCASWLILFPVAPAPAQNQIIELSDSLTFTGLRPGAIVATAPALTFTGLRPGAIVATTQALIFTGLRPGAIVATTQALIFTGLRQGAIVATTQAFTFTGLRQGAIVATTPAFTFTGLRQGAIVATTPAFTFTGLRPVRSTEQTTSAKPSIEEARPLPRQTRVRATALVMTGRRTEGIRVRAATMFMTGMRGMPRPQPGSTLKTRPKSKPRVPRAPALRGTRR